MGEFSTRMAATATRLITARGEQVTLTRTLTGSMTASGDRTSMDQPIVVRAVMLPGDGEQLTEGRQRSGRVLIAAVSPPPATGNVLAFPPGLNAGEWFVDKVKNLGPEGELIYSELEVSQ